MRARIGLAAAAALLLVSAPPAAAGGDPAGDLFAAGRILVEDGAHVYASPLRMSTGDAVKVAAWLAAAGIVYALDDEILDLAERNEDEPALRQVWDAADFLEPVGHMGNTNAWYFGGLALGYVAGQDRLTLICGQILEAHFIAGLGKIAVQAAVGRTRPFEGFGSREFGRADATSFPSGHAINIFQLATILSHHVDRRAFSTAAYAGAGLVAAQRVKSGAHWASDVLLSAAYGTAVARAVLRRHGERGLRLGPHVSELGLGACFACRF